eukprot:328637-Hanusia_phi.AAC.6
MVTPRDSAGTMNIRMKESRLSDLHYRCCKARAKFILGISTLQYGLHSQHCVNLGGKVVSINTTTLPDSSSHHNRDDRFHCFTVNFLM